MGVVMMRALHMMITTTQLKSQRRVESRNLAEKHPETKWAFLKINCHFFVFFRLLILIYIKNMIGAVIKCKHISKGAGISK